MPRSEVHMFWRRLCLRRASALCRRWRSFDNFYADIKEVPIGLTMTARVWGEPLGPDTYIWVPCSAHAKYMRNAKFTSYRGIKLCMSSWAVALGIVPSTLSNAAFFHKSYAAAINEQFVRLQGPQHAEKREDVRRAVAREFITMTQQIPLSALPPEADTYDCAT